MSKNTKLILVKMTLLTGIALWMLIIVLNNVTDPGTQIHLLSKMFGMDLFKDNPLAGQGLLSRAISWPPMAQITLVLVIIYEFLSVLLLWRAAFSYISFLRNKETNTEFTAIKHANIALSVLLFLWFFFMCGGLFFGYWIGMASVQTVHVHLIIVTLITSIIINVDVRSDPAPN
ncbi:MAG: DUF2165 family protein [Desulfobacteraceae bacterium]|jgi:predicted small integral membrane protein